MDCFGWFDFFNFSDLFFGRLQLSRETTTAFPISKTLEQNDFGPFLGINPCQTDLKNCEKPKAELVL